MAAPETLGAGFAFWADEVAGKEHRITAPYIPIIGLAAVYEAFVLNPEKRNSYSWRRAVLESESATKGLVLELSEYTPRVDFDIEDTFEIEIEHIYPRDAAYSSGQESCARESIYDGLPEEITSITSAEEFLATTLGFAVHDYGFSLRNWKVTDSGIYALQSNYPQTADMLAELKKT